MGMHNPPHPGELVREECLAPLGLSVTAAARALGVTRKALSELINGHSGISPEMAIRLFPRRSAVNPRPGSACRWNMICGMPRDGHRDLKVKKLYSGERKAA